MGTLCQLSIWFLNISLRNINTAKSLQKSRKHDLLAAKGSRHWNQVVVWVIHLYLYIYCSHSFCRHYENEKGVYDQRWNVNYTGSQSFITLWYGITSAGLKPFLSHNEKSHIASYHIQFSTNKKIKIIRLKPFFLVPRGRICL